MAGFASTGRHPLDTVVWQALASHHRGFAEGDDRARRYPAAVAPFAAMIDTSAESFRSLLALLPVGDRIVLGAIEPIAPPAEFSIEQRDIGIQMLFAGSLPPAGKPSFSPLGPADVPDMLALVEMTRPGPFALRTIEFGGYIGVRRDGRLVATAGERMRLDGFTEISAVCVDPAWRGHGFAAELVQAVARTIVARGETPLLHVHSANDAAIELYRKLGFVSRRQMHITVLARA